MTATAASEAAGPGGHPGATTNSSATDRSPDDQHFGQVASRARHHRRCAGRERCRAVGLTLLLQEVSGCGHDDAWMSAMMTIGRFAQLSGLSVKALHHYDDMGLLAPAHVDPESGYRWYRGSQARSGATISVLRSMGVPLDVVRRILEEPDRSEWHLARWRADLEAERARQDEAVAAGLRALASYERDSPVVRRQAPMQHYIGLPLDRELLDGDPEAGAAAMERGWQGLDRMVTKAGATPTTAWTTIDPEDGRGAGKPVLWQNAGRIVLCLGLEQPWPDEQVTAGHESGTLPARAELAVVLTADGMPSPDARPGDAAPPAALIALMDAIDREGAPAGTIRQMPRLDETGQFAGLEISVTLEATR